MVILKNLVSEVLLACLHNYVLFLTDFNLGDNGLLLAEARQEDLLLRLNESMEILLKFQLIPNMEITEELRFDVSIGFTNSGKTCDHQAK